MQIRVLNERLSYNLHHVLRGDYFQPHNYTMNCYERIIENVVVILSIRIGISEKVGMFLKEKLASFQHKSDWH